MPIPDVLAVAATSWGIVMALAPTLQIRRMLHTRSSRDVSLTYMAVLLPGFVLWLAYGVSIGNAALMIANAVSLTVMLGTLSVAVLLRRRTEASAPAREAVDIEPGAPVR